MAATSSGSAGARLNLAGFRGSMPIANRFAYYDHAAVSPLPDGAAQALMSYASQASEMGCVPWLKWAAGVSQLREAAATLIGATTDEIALVNSTTQGINLVAEGFPWKEGDNLVVPDNEFPSNLLPWRNLARRGVELRLVPVPPSGEITPGDIAPLIDSRTRLIAISWVGFLSGFRIDLAAMAELAHSRGCLLSLDAIQGLGAFPIDVRSCGVDFLSADGHKWMLGPEGAGIFYCQREHLNLLQPLGLGWNSLASGGFDPASIAIKDNAARYEGGATNMPGMLGLGASLRLLNEHHGLSLNRDLPRPLASPVAAAILENVAELEELLTGAGFVCHLPADPNHRGGILRVSWPEADAVGESAYMEARKHCIARDVVLSVRGGCIRISPHAYNNRDDHERLVAALNSFGKR